ncbi:hypothetical protein Q3G72_007533 [Acer saccharum]|nr:hypothetical protein Q3G72_007533 [Acer saccharum]
MAGNLSSSCSLLLLLLQTTFWFPKPAHSSTISTGIVTRTLARFSPSISPSRHCLLKEARSVQFRTRTSVQLVTEELEDKSKDSSVIGDSIRQRFHDFYASRGHKILPSSSLVPDDPTVLLTIAGMLQFKPIFLGKAPRQVLRATTSQKCIRTNDVENVGRTSRHHTFFEMLGNFSLGDYFKKEAIKWAWDLSTKEYGLPARRLWISVYEDDDEAFEIWNKEIGVPVERILMMGEEDFHPERGYSDVVCNDEFK